jgi:hypothetical protein
MNERHRLAPLFATSGRAAPVSALIVFLDAVWDYEPDAFTFLSIRRADGTGWRDHPIQGKRTSQLRELLTRYPANRHDLYFCPNAFSEPCRLKQHALPTRYAWNDIDDDDPDQFKPRPNVLWETSPGRHQGLWIWRQASPGLTAEQYSRGLWERNGGDSGGWSVTKVLRLPGTINHKPIYDRPIVRLIRFDPGPQRMPLSLASGPLSSYRTPRSGVDPTACDSVEVIKRYRRAVGPEVRQLLAATRVERRDRSKRVFQIVAALVTAGASDNEIGSVLWVNPYFLDKWGHDIDALERQVDRIRAIVGATG